MSPALNGSSAIRRSECGDTTKIRDGITLDFYMGLPLCSLPRYGMAVVTLLHVYRIAGNFRGRKLSRIGDFSRENFHGLLACAAPKMPHPQNLQRKLSRIATKPQNSRKFFPLKVSAIRYVKQQSRCAIRDCIHQKSM